jgi:DNA mismatch repair protein MutS2
MLQEWNSIIDWIGEKSLSEYGKRSLHEAERFSFDECEHEFALVREAAALSNDYRSLFPFNLDSVKNVTEMFEANEPLEAMNYRTIGDFLGVVRRSGEELKRQGFTPKIHSLLDFEYNVSLEMTIKQVVNEKGEINSNASPELAKIRKQLADTHRNIGDEIKKMTTSPEYSGFLQEDWFTIRDDRYVLPFKSVFKRTVKGVIHNYSRTGQTAFLEPMPLIEHNNSLSLLAARELEEIIRILRELRGLLFRNYSYVEKCIERAVHIENIFTKYFWMKENGCAIPEFSDDSMKLTQAWFPPVFLSRGENLVKNDFIFSDEEKIMVVSGPNAGGKTVSIKTVAAIAELAVRGFPVPAASAKLPFFEEIFLILGDNQDAFAGESSFSSHLRLLSATAEKLNSRDLVLIDEIGTGTDPLQGGAIAGAYIEFVAEKGCFSVVTSHLAEVKSIALQNKKFIPVAMGFDEAKDKPTYKFSYNIVGSSNALSLVRKIGFPQEFVEKLEKLLLAKESGVEPLINRLHKKEEQLAVLTEEVEAAKATIKAEEREISELRRKLETKEKQFEETRLRSLKKLVEMEEAELKKKVEKVGEKEIPQKVVLLKKEKETLQDAIDRQTVSLDTKEGEKLADCLDKVIPGKTVVYDKLLKLEGILQKVKGNRAEYMSSGKQLVSPVERLLVIEFSKEVKTKASKNTVESKYIEMCDVRGMFVEDAAEKIEKSLDTAFGGGAVSLTIIHGQGSGKLKKFIRDFLPDLQKKYKFTFAPGSNEEGGDSVTVIRF